MYFEFLGTGNARQVPCFGCDCLACQRAKFVNTYRRGPCSAKIEINGHVILLDAGKTNLTDLFANKKISSILITHYHMDHVQGLFHLRWGKTLSIPVIGPDDKIGCDDLFKHPGILDFQPSPQVFEPFDLHGIKTTALPLNHSKPTVGYFFEFEDIRLAYLTDTLGLPEATENFLRENRPTILVIDCSYPPIDNPKNHNSLSETLSIIDSICPEEAYLTHIGHDLDTYILQHKYHLPLNTYLASDGLKLSLSRKFDFTHKNSYA